MFKKILYAMLSPFGYEEPRYFHPDKPDSKQDAILLARLFVPTVYEYLKQCPNECMFTELDGVVYKIFNDNETSQVKIHIVTKKDNE